MSKAEEIKDQRTGVLLRESGVSFIQFKGQTLFSGTGTKGFRQLTERDFSKIAYEAFGNGVSKGNISDLQHAISAVAPDWSHTDHLFAFRDQVWDMNKLEFVDDQFQYVYSTSIEAQPHDSKGYKNAWNFVLELAQNDEELAHDYLQGIAPLLMHRKPNGVLWFVGDGANGKSSLIDAIYRLIGAQFLTSITTAGLEDGRDTPSLNGKLGNIVRESSEGRVEDTERYKAIGTHENFNVHKFHSQDSIEIIADFHTIFNANNIPVFSDKTKGARRRTLILPFLAHFSDDPTFEARTFTDEFLGGFATLLMEETLVIRDNGYRYKWSDATIQAKAQYDAEVNSAEAFVEFLEESKVAGFMNYNRLKIEYENWCNANGMIPLGITSLKRTMNTSIGAIRKSVREGENVMNRYFTTKAYDKDEDLVWLDNGYGMPMEKTAKPVEQGKLDSTW